MHLLDLHRQERRAHRAVVRPARRRRLRGLLRRHRRQCLCARRGNRAGVVVAAAGRPSLRSHHRIAHAVSGSPVRAGLVDGRDRRQPAWLRMLHVPRQPERARRENRRHPLANLDGAGGAGRRKERRRRSAVGTIGCRHLVGADDRRQARSDLRRHRQYLQRAGPADRRRDCRLRSAERRDQVDPSVDRRRRLRLPRRQRELWREGGAGLRSRNAADAGHGGGAGRDHRGAEIRQRVRARCREGGCAALAVSRRRRIDLGWHPMGRRRRR